MGRGDEGKVQGEKPKVLVAEVSHPDFRSFFDGSAAS